MKSVKIVLVAVLIVSLSFSSAFAKEAKVSKAAAAEKIEIALKSLVEGNVNYVASKSSHPNQDSKRRAETAGGQHPFAVVIGCADSRVPPEIIFDRGIGDLFVIRVAGNVLDDVAVGSVEYALEHLGAPLVVVLGHKKCGAVDATVKGGEAPGHIKAIVEKIKPSVEKAKKMKGDLLSNSIDLNVAKIVEELKESKPIVAEFVESGKAVVIGACYDIETGRVEFYHEKK